MFRRRFTMGPRSKKEYTEAIHKRYKHASRSEKKLILDEFCATSGYHRKYAIMLLKGYKRFRKPTRKKRGPKPVYRKDEIIKPLKKIWLAVNLPCSKRLKVILPVWLPGYAQQFGMLPLDIVQDLRHISPATIDGAGYLRFHARTMENWGARFDIELPGGYIERGPLGKEDYAKKGQYSSFGGIGRGSHMLTDAKVKAKVISATKLPFNPQPCGW
jgi:hypothetical protein